MKYLIFGIIFHFIGSIFCIWKCIKNGAIKEAVQYGNSKPSSIIFVCLFIWEIVFIVYLWGYIGISIDNYYEKKFSDKE